MSAEALAARLEELAATGQAELRALAGEFRRSVVLLPVTEDGGLPTLAEWGIRWLPAFTDEAALQRFASARGERYPEHVEVHGARLLDQVVPRIGVPTGVVVDVGSPAGMALPPLSGLVPDSVALDVRAGEARGDEDEGVVV